MSDWDWVENLTELRLVYANDTMNCKRAQKTEHGPLTFYVVLDWSGVFLTVHDVGSSYMTWRQFVKDTSMEDIRKRYIKVMI